MTPKQRVMAEFKRFWGKRVKPRVCVLGKNKLTYLVMAPGTTIGIGSSPRAAWADAARKIK